MRTTDLEKNYSDKIKTVSTLKLYPSSFFLFFIFKTKDLCKKPCLYTFDGEDAEMCDVVLLDN